jgi:hypothetical protein
MATIKNIPDSYTINVPLMTVNGNLVVTGNTSVIESTNTSIYDNNIVLNAGLSPNIAPSLNAGITVDRGTQANVVLQWNESVKSWQLTNNGTNYGNVIVSSGTNGNINITGATLYTNSTNGSIQIFANTAGSGGSGVYVTNTQTTDAELVTKAKAVAYSIVFG